MIRDSYARAFVELRDPAFRRTTLIGAALSLALLFALYALLIQLFTGFEDEVFTFSDGTRMDRLGNFFSVISIATMMLLSVILMAPTASLFTGLHLHAVADRIEARHYPGLVQARPQSTPKLCFESITYFGLMFFINMFALIGFTMLGWLWGMVLFWVVNGGLLAREYSMMICQRRTDISASRAFIRRNRRVLVVAGTAFAALLSVPFVNLVMPVIGVAAFTHLIHQLSLQTSEGAIT